MVGQELGIVTQSRLISLAQVPRLQVCTQYRVGTYCANHSFGHTSTQERAIWSPHVFSDAGQTSTQVLVLLSLNWIFEAAELGHSYTHFPNPELKSPKK